MSLDSRISEYTETTMSRGHETLTEKRNDRLNRKPFVQSLIIMHGK